MKKVAIFDIDGTIFRSSLLIELTKELVNQNLFPAKARAIYERAEIDWLDRTGDYDTYIMKVVESFMKYLKGISYQDFDRISKELISRQKERTYKYTRDLIKQLKRKDYFLLAISQSPKTILDKFCSNLGFDKVYGRIYELGPTDRFTGQVVDEHLIRNKATILRRAVEKNNLTLKDSVGVGDTDGDVPFLELVGKPICFNPNALLLKQAKRNGWQVVVERKDVVYEIPLE